MRLEWLEDILAVAETGSLREAAERRRLTQSAFSRRIQGIEDFVGVPLFDRSRKPVQLRPTTQAQRAQIATLATGLRQLVADLQSGDRLSANRIVIASQHALTAAFTPAIIAGIQARNSSIYVRLRSANLNECFSLLLSRQADIALAFRLPGEEHPVSADYIESVKVGTDRLVPVFDARKERLLEDQFARGEIGYITYPAEVFLGQALERLVLQRARADIALVPRAETALTLAAVELAAIGAGVAWVPGLLAAGRIADGTLLDLSHRLPCPEFDITAVRIGGNAGPGQRAIWDHLTAGRSAT